MQEVDISVDSLVALFQTMLKIRLFEEKIAEIYPQQEIRCPVHLCIGQEAIAAGVCLSLKKEDYVFSNHRCHGHCIAKGMSLRPIMAELFGRKTGCSKGRGGSPHLIDLEHNILGTSAMVGGGIAHAVGVALASSMRKEFCVSVAFFGDGAVDTGSFHECLNFAALRRLPVLFVCENNLYATHSHILARQPADNIYKRAEGYCIPGFRVDGNDVLAVHRLAKTAIERARNFEGPTLLECRTYRWMGHVSPSFDIHFGYRSQDELDAWIKRCPIKRFREFLLGKGVVSISKIEEIKTQITQEIEDALDFARNSPFPGAEELYDDVYKDGD